jgi:hypothetical protein
MSAANRARALQNVSNIPRVVVPNRNLLLEIVLVSHN